MGLTKILPHLAVSATLLFLRTICPLTMIVASVSLTGTRKRLLSTRFALTVYRMSCRCSSRNATSARFNQVTDEGIIHASGYALPVDLSISTCIYDDSFYADVITAAFRSNKISIRCNFSSLLATSVKSDNLRQIIPVDISR